MGVRFYFNGKYYDVPQAVSKIEVIKDLVGLIQDMGVTLIVGRAMAGYPGLGHDSDIYAAGEAAPANLRYIADIAPAFSDSAAARREYGEDSELARSMAAFKSAGGAMALCMNVQPVTRTSGTLIEDAGVGDNDAVKVWSREFGAHTCDIYHNIAAVETTKRSIELTKPRHVRYLSADTAEDDTYITIESTDPDCISHLSDGDTVHLVDNVLLGASGITLTVDRLDHANKRIYFTVALPALAVYQTSEYARIFEMNLDAAIEDSGTPITPDEYTSTGIETDAQFVDWIQNDSDILNGELGSDGGLPDAGEGWLGEDSDGATYIVTPLTGQGTSPLPTTTDWTAMMTQIKSVIKENEVRILSIGDDPDGLLQVEGPPPATNANHISLDELIEMIADLETSEPPYPITVICGDELGDTLEETTSDRYPNARALTMNNDRIVLADIGLNDQAAYLKYAPEVAGDLSSHKTNHNLTNDKVVATKIEDELRDYRDELAPRIRAGVLTIKSTKIGPVICRGMNTLQDNLSYWTADGHTCSIMRRRIVDQVALTLSRGYSRDMVGNDGITETRVHAYADSTLVMLRDIEGIITEFKNLVITRVSGHWFVAFEIKTDEETDFFGITVKVIE